MRNHYKMPPTDPRYLAMTPEQIWLEWEHYLLDNPELREEKNFHHDPEFDEWAAEDAADDWEEVDLDPDGREDALCL